MRWPVQARSRSCAGSALATRILSWRRAAIERVLAAAPGRVIFESWSNGGGLQTIWIEHGPDLFTVVLGPRPRRRQAWPVGLEGRALGSLAGICAALLFSVSVGALPTSTMATRSTRFLSLS